MDGGRVMLGAGERPGAAEKGDVGGIVWLEKGEERAFEPLPELRRPWLEESSTWGAGPESDPKTDGPSGDSSDPPELIWL